MGVRRLEDADQAALDELLEADTLVNLFLRGFLAAQPMDRGFWYGVERMGRLDGVLLLLPHRLCVPWAPDMEVAAELGTWLGRRHRPTMMVGPRDHVDVIWSEWKGKTRAKRFYDQRLYATTTPAPGGKVPGFRQARIDEWPLLATRAARMEWEDLGRDPSAPDPELHRRVVKDRIRAGKTLVMERDSELVFQVNVGTATPEGAQIGGTYVPPGHRGRGYATEGMRATVNELLRGFPVVSLHVNEANTPAVRCYEAAGFRPAAPYRLLTV